MIQEEMIFIDEDIDDKDSVIKFIIHNAMERKLISNKEDFYTAVKDRENVISTYVGHSIAIPHGKSSAVIEPFIAYVRVKKPFDWNDEDDEVESIFLIGVPENDTKNIHLKFISQVSKKLINDEFRTKLFDAKNREEAFILLSLINEEL